MIASLTSTDKDTGNLSIYDKKFPLRKDRF